MFHLPLIKSKFGFCIDVINFWRLKEVNENTYDIFGNFRKFANFELIFEHEGIKYQGYSGIYSERSIFVLSEYLNRFQIHLQDLSLFCLQSYPLKRAVSACILSKFRWKTKFLEILSKIFGFLVLWSYIVPIFIINKWILLSQIAILWRHVCPPRRVATRLGSEINPLKKTFSPTFQDLKFWHFVHLISS